MPVPAAVPECLFRAKTHSRPWGRQPFTFGGNRKRSRGSRHRGSGTAKASYPRHGSPYQAESTFWKTLTAFDGILAVGVNPHLLGELVGGARPADNDLYLIPKSAPSGIDGVLDAPDHGGQQD